MSAKRPLGNYATKSAPTSGLRSVMNGGPGLPGLGKGKSKKRFRAIAKDTIQGVTKGDIRRLARRGGVKRIQGLIYGDVRLALRERLESILKDVAAVVEGCHRKTVMTSDVVFVLRRQGQSLWGFGDAAR